MALHLSFRAELANQLVVRLKRFDETTWREAERAAQGRDLFDIAYTLAHDAVSLLAEEFGPDLQAVLGARLGDVDALFSDSIEEALEYPRNRWRIARAAVLAVYLRDSRGFNVGAFEQLFAPVAPYIDIGELERTALASLGDATGDFQVAQPPRHHEPPAITEGRRPA